MSSQAVKRVQVVKCPYDPLHIMPKQSFPRHLEKCKSKNKDEFRQCPFSIFHIMKKQLIDQHIINCPSKNDLQDLYDDQWNDGDQQCLQVQDWESQQSYGMIQQRKNKQLNPPIKYERNILTESIVRPININDEEQSLTPAHQLAQQMRSLIINCEEDKQSESYWLGEKQKKKHMELKNQPQVSQVKDKQSQLSTNANSRVFAQSCIINRQLQGSRSANKMLEMSFYQGMKPIQSNGHQNNNQNFIIDYSISQVHNYNHSYPQYYPPYYQYGYHPQYGYNEGYMPHHMHFPYQPMNFGHFQPNQQQHIYERKEQQRKMKKQKKDKSIQKDKKQKKDKKKSKKSDY